MALYAFDGTGSNDDLADRESNVLHFFRAYDGGPTNDNPAGELGSLYLKGIGRRPRSFVGHDPAEAFGVGGHRRVRQALDRLENNFEAGDTVVDAAGFSRGAALAVSFANELAGKYPRVSIRFMALWDMVGHFGAPGRRFNAGHDLGMPTNVVHCCHAMALDEARPTFPLTRLWETDSDTGRLLEVWFRGTQGDVGGSNGNRGLNWLSLNWMYGNARRAGVPVNRAAIAMNFADHKLPQQISDPRADPCLRRVILDTDLLHASVRLDPGPADRPHNNPALPMARIDDDGRIVETT